MTLDIDSDVPMPETGGPDYGELIDAFGKMQIGQSVVFTGSHTYIHSLAGDCGIRIKVRATSGLVANRGAKQYRIWRIG